MATPIATTTTTKTNISVEIDALSEALKSLSTLATVKTGGGASNGILFSSHENDAGEVILTLMATNGQVAALQRIKAVSLDGIHSDFLVPAKLLNAVVSSYPTGGEIELRFGTELEVVKGKLNYKLSTLAPDDFPNIDFMEGNPIENNAWTNAGGLFDVLSIVAQAAASDKSTPYLNGVFIEHDGTNLVATSTDSYRMMRETYGPFDTQFDAIGEIISKDLINYAEKFFSDMDDIAVQTHGGHVTFANKDWTRIVWNRGISGNFPPVGQIIDASYPASLTVETDELLAVLNRMKYIARDQHAKVTITFGDGTMNVSVNTVDAQADEDVAITRNDAEQWEKLESIKFNFSHLFDGVLLYEGHDNLNISFNTPTAPARFWVDGEATEYLAMLMR